jgi:hypothetical protein
LAKGIFRDLQLSNQIVIDPNDHERTNEMKPLDLKDIYNGLITVIIIALAIGQYGRLREFAKKEFVRSMVVHSAVRNGDIELPR